MQSASKYYIVELHLVVNDQQNRFLNKAFDFGRMIYNATLGTALGQLQQMRESKEWAKIKAMPKGDDRNKAMAAIYNDYHLSDYHLRTISTDIKRWLNKMWQNLVKTPSTKLHYINLYAK